MAYEVFEATLSRRTGPIPEGVRRFLKVAYYSGAMGALSTTRLIQALPLEEQQAAVNAVGAEIAKVLL